MREFVYLDDVSVYSLIASRLGPVAAEFTATESNSLRSEIGSSGAVSAGVAKAEVSSRVEGTQTSGSQVVRHSIVQATFKELFELEEDRLVLRATAPSGDVPVVKTAASLKTAANAGGITPWIVDAAALRRGELLEVQVELEAEAIYRMSATLSALIEIVEESPELVGLADREGVLQGMTASRVLERLLAGLVPLRGRAIDYRRMTVAGKDWLVHEEVLAQLPETNELSLQPVHVVGVAEEDLFWKDIRRVAFSHSRFVVMCRVNRDGLQATWTPVKLVQVLEEFLPDLARQLDQASRGLLTAMAESDALDADSELRERHMRAALVEYAGALAAHHGHSVGEADLSEAELPTREQCSDSESLEARRAAFRAVSEHLQKRYGIARDPLVEAQFRAAALLDNGLGAGALGQSSRSGAAPPPAEPSECYLDAEFVAIYW